MIPPVGNSFRPLLMPALGLGLGLPFVATRGGEGISALDAWLSGATYADWDPSKLDRMFTTSTGPTNVASNGDATGLLIGGSQLGGLTVPAYLAAAPELVTNGDFATGDLTGWTNESTGTGTAVYSGGAVVVTGTNSNRGAISRAFTCVVGRTYRFSWDVLSGSGSAGIGSSGALNVTVTGTIAASASGFVFFVATATTHYVRVYTPNSTSTCTFDNISIKELPGYHALQSTSGDRPQYQSGYLRGDGSSDNLLTTWLCGAGANTAIAKCVVPGSLAGTQALVGTIATTRFLLGFNTSGNVIGRIGTDATTGITGTADLRSKTVVVAVSIDGSTVKLFAYSDGAATEQYSGAQAGAAESVSPCRLLAYNNSGSAAAFFSGDLGRTIAARKAMSLAEFTAIAPLLAA